MDCNSFMAKAKMVAQKVQGAAVEATPAAKKTMQELGNTANVFVAALKNNPKMATKEETPNA